MNNTAIAKPGIPNKPVSTIIHQFIIIPIPKNAHIAKTIPPTIELIINLIAILNGRAIIFNINTKIANAIIYDKIFIS